MAAPVTHVLTVHWQSPWWIEPQLRHLRRYVPGASVWASLDGIDTTWDEWVDHALRLEGTHAEKLNQLAALASADAAPDDVLMFLDGDAFPIAPVTDELLDGVALAAVRRDENLGDPQPHPCFCVTTVEQWDALGGDWREGPSWINASGTEVSDVGARLLERLEATGIGWRALRRTNRRNLDPILFGVYGDVVYHHGAGFRFGRTRLHATRANRRRATGRRLVEATPGRLPRAAARRINRAYLGAADALFAARTERLERRVRRTIERGDDISELLLRPPGVLHRHQRGEPLPALVIGASGPTERS